MCKVGFIIDYWTFEHLMNKSSCKSNSHSKTKDNCNHSVKNLLLIIFRNNTQNMRVMVSLTLQWRNRCTFIKTSLEEGLEAQNRGNDRGIEQMADRTEVWAGTPAGLISTLGPWGRPCPQINHTVYTVVIFTAKAYSCSSSCTPWSALRMLKSLSGIYFNSAVS